MIRWVDMVDLRGKPPYLPDSKTYTDVLKQAIEDAFNYYGYNPETYLESSPDVPGLLDEKPRAFPALKRTVVPLPMPSLITMKPQEPTTMLNGQSLSTAPQNVSMQLQSKATAFPAVPTMSSNTFVFQHDNSVLSDVNDNDVNNVEDDTNDVDDDDDDEDDENLPPKLPMPIGKMNCSLTRTVLAKLIRFHCGNQVNVVTCLFAVIFDIVYES